MIDTMSYDQIIYMTDKSLLAYDEHNELYYVVIVNGQDSRFYAYRTFKKAKQVYDEKIKNNNNIL